MSSNENPKDFAHQLVQMLLHQYLERTGVSLQQPDPSQYSSSQLDLQNVTIDPRIISKGTAGSTHNTIIIITAAQKPDGKV